MRKILIIAILILSLTSCSLVNHGETNDCKIETTSKNSNVTNELNEIPNTAQYTNQFDSFRCSSIEEMYRILDDLSIDMTNEIRTIENMFIEDTSKLTLVHDEELEKGIFENFRQNLMYEKKVMIPYINNTQVSLEDDDEYYIEISPSGSCLKPWITYYDQSGLTIKTMYYDDSLSYEANIKGASWLKSVLDPYGMNVYNYEDYKQAYLAQGYTFCENTIVYEKVYDLGDRSVNAMVIDNSGRVDHPNLNVYFVYDDIFACVYGTPEEIDANIGQLTFYEVDLETGIKINDWPGRKLENTVE